MAFGKCWSKYRRMTSACVFVKPTSRWHLNTTRTRQTLEGAAGRTAGVQIRLATKRRRFMGCLLIKVSQRKKVGKGDGCWSTHNAATAWDRSWPRAAPTAGKR